MMEKQTILRRIVVSIVIVLVLTTFALCVALINVTGCGVLNNFLESCNSSMDPQNTGTYTRDGSTIYLGTYPQTKVTDSNLISTLNSLAGTLPTSDNAQDWISYSYYENGNKSNYMWFIDVISGAKKYRGVYFIKYRPHRTDDNSGTNQYDNGYYTSNVYWFKYEPISWTILDESKGLILCDMIIDSQQYDVSWNDYEDSDIRAWLNDNFYNTAFTTLQKNIIKTTRVDNSARSTFPNNNETYWNGGVNTYAFGKTYDKVFLLSQQEVTNSIYGFDEDIYYADTARCKKTTDYAQSQGCNTSTFYIGNGWWWLRSPLFDGSTYSCRVNVDGDSQYGYYYVDYTGNGVVPALQIQF